ncbi:MAG: putative metallopeptidase [Syntrophorhabdaceae bacterium]|nr:putative metallopeptidase [Syntrophorhabdaceae bacterium]
MGLRYEEVDDEVVSLLRETKAKYFPELKNAKIKVLFDLKKRKSGGMMVLARIMKTNDLLRHLTIEDAGDIEGYDYIITIDKLCWNNIKRVDRERILRHELRHTLFDLESEDNPYKLRDHTITDFYEEIELNKDDPRWRERLSTLTADIYEQQKELRKKKGKKKETL